MNNGIEFLEESKNKKQTDSAESNISTIIEHILKATGSNNYTTTQRNNANTWGITIGRSIFNANENINNASIRNNYNKLNLENIYSNAANKAIDDMKKEDKKKGHISIDLDINKDLPVDFLDKNELLDLENVIKYTKNHIDKDIVKHDIENAIRKGYEIEENNKAKNRRN